jgi:hypothetical protein
MEPEARNGRRRGAKPWRWAEPRAGQRPETVNGPEPGHEPKPAMECQAGALGGPATGRERGQHIAPSARADLSGPPRLPITFSRPGTKATVLLTVGIVPLLLLGAALNPSGFWWARLIAGLVVLAAGVVMARIALVAIIAKPDRLVIRNLRNTHRILWSQVAEIFETPPPPSSVYRDNPLYRREIDLLIGLTDGSVVSATLSSHRLFHGDHSSRREVIDRLNELRRQLAPRSGGASSVADKGPDLLS